MPKKEAAAAPALTADQLALIAERDAILVWLEPAKKRELEIRNQLAAELFPNPTEGTNRLVTADGYEVTLDHKINRKLDEAALDTVMLELPEDAQARIPGVLIQYKPALVLSGLRAMPAEQLKIFGQAMTETPGAPGLDIKRQDIPGDPSAGHPPGAEEQIVREAEQRQAAEGKKSRVVKAGAKKAGAKGKKTKK